MLHEPDGPAAVDRLVESALTGGEPTLMGDIPRASNSTSLVVVDHADRVLKAVYKPIAGERPLHDFPDGTLGLREVAAYRLSAHLGLRVVPPTVLRTDLPHGPGSLQAYVEDAGDDADVALTEIDGIPEAFAPMFALRTEDGRDLVLSHSLGEELRRVAFFDLLAGNADRKAGHIITGSVLPGVTGGFGTFGIDNGLSFHPEEKLRTVLWGFADSAFDDTERAALDEVAAMPAVLVDALTECLRETEITALAQRAQTLADTGIFPPPPEDRTAIPWPPI